jgi:hypothetical protein
MDWLDLLYDVLEVCVVPILGILTTYLIKYIQIKSQEAIKKSENETLDKYIAISEKIIVDCVLATNQTYVESLKKENAFTAEAQKEALNKTLDAVLSILSNDAKECLSEAYGDLTKYITTKIEAEIVAKKAQ